VISIVVLGSEDDDDALGSDNMIGHWRTKAGHGDGLLVVELPRAPSNINSNHL